MRKLEKIVNEILNKKEFKEYPPFPRKNLLIEVTNYCNNRCIFCANKDMTRKRKFISPHIVEKVLNECYNLGTREVGFYATGEPLINTNLEKYIKLAKDIGFEYVYITTNGILADTKKIESLFRNGLDSIKFSINAIDKEKYLNIHGTDLFENVIENLKNAYKIRESNYKNVKIFVSYIMTKYSMEDKQKIMKFFNKYCDEVVIDMAKNQGGLIKNINGLVNETSNIVAPCFYVFNSINITCEGFITACCMDFQNYLAYADLNNTTVEEAWKSKIITELRKKHLCNKLEGTICDNCIKGIYNKVEPVNKELATIIKN